MDSETEAGDPFFYKPLKLKRKRSTPRRREVTKKVRRKTGGGVKEEVAEGIVQLFEGQPKTVMIKETLSVCPWCQLPLKLLNSSSMITPAVHLQDCRDTLMDQESNPLPRPFCPDMKECQSEEIVHYSRFSHSLQDWLQNQPHEDDAVASGEVEDVSEEAENTKVTGCEEEYTEVEDWEDAGGCAGNKLDGEELQSEVAKKALPEQEGGFSRFSFGAIQDNETLNSSIVLELNQDVADLTNLVEENAQETLSQKLKAIIHDLENIPQQPSVAPSEHEVELSSQLSAEVNRKLEHLEQEGGLSAPVSSPSQGVALPLGDTTGNQEKPFEKSSDQRNVDLQGLLNNVERQMEEFNTNRDGVGHTSVKPGEHNKLDEVVERIQKKSVLKASSEGGYSADTNTKPGSINQGSEPGQSTYGAVESEQVFINIWCAGMGKDFRITLKAKKRMTKVMEAVGQRLGKTVTSLKFLAEKEKGMMVKLLNDPKEASEECGWIRLHGKEEVGTFAGATVVVKES